jgi:hypothetical protein
VSNPAGDAKLTRLACQLAAEVAATKGATCCSSRGRFPRSTRRSGTALVVHHRGNRRVGSACRLILLRAGLARPSRMRTSEQSAGRARSRVDTVGTDTENRARRVDAAILAPAPAIGLAVERSIPPIAARETRHCHVHERSDQHREGRKSNLVAHTRHCVVPEGATSMSASKRFQWEFRKYSSDRFLRPSADRASVASAPVRDRGRLLFERSTQGRHLSAAVVVAPRSRVLGVEPRARAA